MVLVLFGAANAAVYVPVEELWFLQVLGVAGSGLGLALVLVGSAAVLARHWWLAGSLLSAVVLAVVVPRVFTPSPVPHRSLPPRTPARLEAEPLRVMTFNASPERLQVEESGLLALLERREPHLIALQEFSVHLNRSTGVRSGPPFLAPFLRDNRFGISWPESRGDVSMGRPILSRLEPVGPAKVVPNRLGGGEGLWASGGITRGTYRWQEQTIAVYNVHLHSFGRERPWREPQRHVLSLKAWSDALRTYRSDFETRAEQARVLRRMLDEEEHPFIVCGDFNSTSYNWVYAYIARGLTDSFRKAGVGWGGTFPARPSVFRIDFILASDEWRVREARVDRALSSDHVPVTAELVLQHPEGRGRAVQLKAD